MCSQVFPATVLHLCAVINSCINVLRRSRGVGGETYLPLFIVLDSDNSVRLQKNNIMCGVRKGKTVMQVNMSL